ncbi:MAG: sulfatase [bacterium]|nr:sulfatase [bacterium]
MRLGISLLFVSLVAAGPPQRHSAPETTKPNILFLLIDDLGWPDLGCYGHAFHETPVIDSLARQGVRLSDFYAATPVCSSTRSTIQSGQYSARTAVTDFIPGHWRPFEKLVVPPIEHRLKAGVQTPGNALKAAGYTTGYFGKWHLGDGAELAPDQHGYQVTERQLGREFQESRGGATRGPKSIDFLTDAALHFIEEHHDAPFFLTLSHYAVHIPVEGRPATIQKYRDKERPAAGVNHPIYAAMTEDLDSSIGKLLAKLEELGIAENTVVVFTSDNGGLRTIFTGVGEVVSTNAPLRGEKGTLYEGGIRVPMIVRWPGVIPAGATCSTAATTADLLPTFCAMAGAELPQQPIDGASLLPLLREPAAELDRSSIYFHYPHYHHSRPAGAIRSGPWKLIEFFDTDELELFHVGDDIGEVDNLVERHPGRARQMQRELAEWRKATGARMPTVNPKYDATRAMQWWSRRANKPLDIEAMRKRYDSRRGK